MEELYTLVSDVFDVDVSTLSDRLGPEDIDGWDSMGQLSLIASVESQYQVTFDVGEIFEIVTIGDLRRLLSKRGKL